MAEFPTLGRHCDFDTCNQLDFLPFPCSQCGRVFCAKHKSCEVHGCSTSRFERAKERHLGSDILSYKCCLKGCDGKELTEIICKSCGFNYCLRHRYPSDHECPIETTTANNEIVRRKMPEALANIVRSDETKACMSTTTRNKPPPVGSKDRQKYNRVKLMKLKMKAIGEKEGVPESEKIYLNVCLPGDSNPNYAVFVSKNWSVGRIVDSIAKLAKLNNDNSSITAKKLRLYTETNDESLEMGIKLENTKLENGADVFIRYDNDKQ